MKDDIYQNVSKDKTMPDFKTAGLNIVKRSAQDDYRFLQIKEIQNLKNLLVKDQIHLDMNVLQKAILLPEDVIFDQTRKMPDPSIQLMKNPFPKD